MEIILAIVVATAVIFFGALISMGNERQWKAIDGLRKQIVLWAVQDLKIKRERLARDMRIDDPLTWLSQIAGKVCGYPMNLQILEVSEDGALLVCRNNAHSNVLVSLHSPADIQRMKHGRRSRLSHHDNRSPLFSMPRKTKSYEASVLNTGIFFDLELPLAWKELTNQVVNQHQLWIYVIA